MPHRQSGTFLSRSQVFFPIPPAKCATALSLVMTRSQLAIMAAVSRKSQVLLIKSWQLTKRSLKEHVFSCSLPNPFWSERSFKSMVDATGANASRGNDLPFKFLASCLGLPCQ